MNFQAKLLDAMSQNELYIDHLNMEEGKYHYFKSKGICRKSSKCCRYRIFENELGAHLLCHRRGINKVWFAKDLAVMSREEKYELRQERERIDQERAREQSKAIMKCRGFFDRCYGGAERHPYAIKKRIVPYTARTVRGMLVVPVRDIDFEIQTLQFIKQASLHSNNFKQFKTGAPSKNGMIWLCNPLQPDYSGVIRICEGYSTGCTIRQITNSPVVCALNAAALPKVAVLLRRKYQHANLKICADNDQWGKENTGLNYAFEADLLANAVVYWPEFDGLNVSKKPTDFNDLFVLSDRETVKKQLILVRKMA